MTPNLFAYAMLLIWPVMVAWMFKAMSRERAIIWSILGGYLLLPPLTAFDFPVIPPIDKVAVPSLSALLAVRFLLGEKIKLIPRSNAVRALLALYVVAPFPTYLTNPEAIVFQSRYMPSLTAYDAFSQLASHLIILVPFALASQFLRTTQAMREIVIALVVAGLLYSVPMLVEVRLSPQLNTWIYGFFQHSFEQMMRYGGYRPIVFLPHGLWVAFFALTCVMAAVAAARLEPDRLRKRYVVVSLYLIAVLILCKSAAAIVYGVALLPLIALAGPRLQAKVAIVLVAFSVLYPVLRINGLVPVETIVGYANQIDPDRAASLDFRVMNENLLLERANEKPIFGWGAWGRSFLYDQTGKMTSTVDGYWIIVFGSFGWLGYLGTFGLLGYVVLLAAKRTMKDDGLAAPDYASVVALVVAINMIDMLINATITPLTWLLAGALIGYAEIAAVSRTAPAPQLSRTVIRLG